jgi:NADPH:quinone reductase-like Zn-dependent oxidoreductase
VVIIGAGGGVGTFAVQIAKALGAEVTGVCSTAKTDLVQSIGADHVIDYTQGDFADGRQRYDVIFDTAGRRSLSHLRGCLSQRFLPRTSRHFTTRRAPRATDGEKKKPL